MDYRKFYSCTFIGHRTINNNSLGDLDSLIKLIVSKNKNIVFNFGDKSEFNDICFNIVKNLKKDNYNNIYTNCYITYKECQLTLNYKNYLLSIYDFITYIDDNHKINKYIYINRNKKMINNSDLCVFYYDENNVKTGTRIAYEYAVKKQKKIINVYLKKD